jgi:hypothetical protein
MYKETYNLNAQQSNQLCLKGYYAQWMVLPAKLWEKNWTKFRAQDKKKNSMLSAAVIKNDSL